MPKLMLIGITVRSMRCGRLRIFRGLSVRVEFGAYKIGLRNLFNSRPHGVPFLELVPGNAKDLVPLVACSA
jgi:hypothetical protein